MDTDFGTIQLIKNGDIHEFQLLYKKYQNKIFLYFLSRVNNREDALDLTMDTFERALQFINTFKENSIFKTWLYGIAKNVLFSFYTNRKTDPITVSSFDFDTEDGIDNLNFDEKIRTLDSEYEQTQTYHEENLKKEKVIEKIFSELPIKYSEILRLRYLLNYSIRDIAQEFDITENTAKVTLFRSLEKAKQIAPKLIIEKTDYLDV